VPRGHVVVRPVFLVLAWEVAKGVASAGIGEVGTAIEVSEQVLDALVLPGYYG
jgi:hypothetical protein